MLNYSGLVEVSYTVVLAYVIWVPTALLLFAYLCFRKPQTPYEQMRKSIEVVVFPREVFAISLWFWLFQLVACFDQICSSGSCLV